LERLVAIFLIEPLWLSHKSRLWSFLFLKRFLDELQIPFRRLACQGRLFELTLGVSNLLDILNVGVIYVAVDWH
jgi:hypothetical protein